MSNEELNEDVIAEVPELSEEDIAAIISELAEPVEEELPEGFAEAEINPEFTLLPAEATELTTEQKAAFDNINKMFALKQEAIISSILDGLAEEFRNKQAKAAAKVENKKGKRIYQYDAGYLKAFEDIFNSLYSFLYTIKEQPVTTEEKETTDE